MAPKTRRRRTEDSGEEFLFVHEDANTVTGRSRDPFITRMKQSHAQRRTFELKQHLKEQQQQTWESADDFEAFGSFALEVVESDATDESIELGFDLQSPYNLRFSADRSDAPLELRETTQSFQPTIPYTSLSIEPALLQQLPSSTNSTYRPGYFLDDTALPRETTTSQLLSRNRDVSLQFPLRARNIHPMFSGQFRILEEWAPPLIQHFNTILLPEKFWADTLKVPLRQMRHAPAIHAEMQDVMSQPAHLYSFLAAASAQMLSREGKLLLPGLQIPDHRVTLFFKTKAIEAIRHILAMGVLTHRLVLDVHCLISNAYFSHAYEAAEPHFAAMHSMIERLGGIQTFDDYFRESSILLDWSAGLKKLASPRLPVDFDPDRGSPAVALTLREIENVSSGVGDRFQELCQNVCQPLAEAALQHLEALRLHEWCRNNTIYDPQYYRWLSLRRLAIGYRLLAMQPRADIKAECFRIALIFWTALTRCPTSGQRCASLQAHTLRARLRSSDLDSFWGEKSNWLFWIAVVGGLASRDQLDTQWFANIAAKVAEKNRVNVTNVEEVEAALASLLYDKDLQREPLSKMMKIMSSVS